MSKGPEYTFLPKPLTMAERSEAARDFWLGIVGEDSEMQAVVKSEYDNPEIVMTDGRLFEIAKEMQSLRVDKPSK